MSKKHKRRYNNKELTNHLRELAAEVHDWIGEDGSITKGEALSALIWRAALGWEEKRISDEGDEEVIIHKYERWAVELLIDRMEGKTAMSTIEDSRRITVAEQVGELAKKRLNRLVDLAAAKTTPPEYKPPSTDTPIG